MPTPNKSLRQTANESLRQTIRQQKQTIDEQSVFIQNLQNTNKMNIILLHEKETSIQKQKQTIDEQSVIINDLLCANKDVVVHEPEMTFKVGDYLDARDRMGKWDEAIVKIHKHASDDMPNKSPPPSKKQLNDIKNLKHLEALYVHYTTWDDTWNQWIFIQPGRTICKCHTACTTDKHRIAAHNTQSKSHNTQSKSHNTQVRTAQRGGSSKLVPFKSLIVDVFHRKSTERVNKPVRHVFHVDKGQKVSDLAEMVAKCYDTKIQFVLFYENCNMKVAREYDHNFILDMVPHRDAIGCYILKDWNAEVAPQEIKTNNLSLQIAKVCHSAPLSDKKGRSRDGPLFGMPFIISFPNTHTRRQVHQVIYQRLFVWVGPDVLAEPPAITKLKKISKAQNKDKDAYGADEEEMKYEHIKPSNEEMAKYETEWDEILKDVPYTLRLLPYRHYSFYSSKLPEVIPIDDTVFVAKLRNDKDIDIIIEWGVEANNKIQTVVNKVVVDRAYSEWKKEKLKQKARRT
eukprot:519847_1